MMHSNKTIQALCIAVFSLIVASTVYAQAPGHWRQHYDPGYYYWPVGVVQRADGGFILAIFNDDENHINLQLYATDGGGTLRYSTAFQWNDSTRYFSSVIADGDGELVLVGTRSNYYYESGRAYAVEVNLAGEILWEWAATENYQSHLRSIIQVEDGFVAVGEAHTTGIHPMIVKLSTTGDLEWMTIFDTARSTYAKSVVRVADGRYAIAGDTYTANLSYNAWIAFVSATGDSLNAHEFVSPGDQRCVSVLNASTGGCLICGYSESTDDHDLMMVKINDFGDSLWTRTIPTQNSQYAVSAVQGMNDEVFFFGREYTEDYNMNAIVAALNETADLLWIKRFEGFSSFTPSGGLTPTNDAGVALATMFGSQCNGRLTLIRIGQGLHQPYMSFEPYSVDFDDVYIGCTDTVWITVTNTEAEPFTLLTFELPYYFDSDFMGPVTLTSGESTILNIIYTPTGTDQYGACAELISTSEGGSAFYSISVHPDRAISVSPEPIEFAPTAVLDTTSMLIRVYSFNAFPSTVIISEIIASEGFYVYFDGPDTLIDYNDDHRYIEFELTFAPEHEGYCGGHVAVHSDWQCSPRLIPVYGIGLPAPLTIEPEVLDFGFVEPAHSQTLMLQIANQSDRDYAVTGFSFDNSLAFSTQIVLPYLLNVDSISEISVTFTPGDSLEYNDQLRLTLTGGLIDLIVPLHGTGHPLALCDEPTIPKTFALHQNYPNPFNPVTTIDFDLPASSWVELEVYNSLGQQVATLVNGPLNAGAYSITWNGTTTTGSKLASGIYVYRIQTADFIDSKKLVFLK